MEDRLLEPIEVLELVNKQLKNLSEDRETEEE
jgi:hypothetical protein